MVISVDEVKTILNISGSSYDDRIEILIPIVTDHIQNYCQTKFMSSSLATTVISDVDGAYYALENTEQVFPVGLKLTASQMIWYQINSNKGNISSETLGAYSVTFNTGYPTSIMELMRPYRNVRFV